MRRLGAGGKAQHPQLRIPMRGYEILARLSGMSAPSSYESPCGVMREMKLLKIWEYQVLRIPMRGYESK